MFYACTSNNAFICFGFSRELENFGTAEKKKRKWDNAISRFAQREPLTARDPGDNYANFRKPRYNSRCALTDLKEKKLIKYRFKNY